MRSKLAAVGLFIAAIILLLVIIFRFNIFGISSQKVSSINGAPYPPSPFVTAVVFDWSTYRRLAPGSDNWTMTWAADNHQYTTWGDGGGFNGTNGDGRVSLGIGRVEGSKDDYAGYNLWGGKNSENPSQFNGKSYGLIAIDGSFYMWRCGDASDATAYKFQQLYASTDQGRTWNFTGVEFSPDTFPESDSGFFCPAFLQFGPDYQAARDNHIYVYAPEIKTSEWAVQKPGEIALLRVPKTDLTNFDQYEFFAGFDASQTAKWTSKPSDRRPVFEDKVNGVMRTSVSYNPGLKRYLLITEHSERSNGNMGLYEASEPWGPWQTIMFVDHFGPLTMPDTTFYWNFANKWFSPDGKDFVLVYTGKGRADSWNSVEGHFELAE